MEPMRPIKGEFTSRDTTYENKYHSRNFESRGSEAKKEKTRERSRNIRQPEIGGPTAIKIAVCLCVLLLCVAVKLSDAEVAQKTSNLMQNALTYDIDVEESLGELKFVQSIFPGVSTVFNGSNGMRYPLDGNVTKSFEDTGETGIEITGAPAAKVVAAMDGQVEKRGKNAQLGNYLRIKHSGSVDTYYYNLKRSALNEGDAVTRGQEIAELGDDGVLVFEVHVRGTSQNPMKYLGKN